MNFAGQAGQAFTSLADAVPVALANAVATVRRLPAAGGAFKDAADAAAGGLQRSAEIVRDGSGGLVNPTVLMSDLNGDDLIPPMIGVAFLILLLLTRLGFVVYRKWVTAAAKGGGNNGGDRAGRRKAGSTTSSRRSGADELGQSGVGGEEKTNEDNEAVGADSYPIPELQVAPRRTEGDGCELRPLPPLQILGPSVTSLEYVVSQPPPEVPSIFATARYRSIHRKLTLDVHQLTFGRCNPLIHPDIDPGDANKFGAAMDGNAYSSPRKGRLLITELAASRGVADEDQQIAVACSGTSTNPKSGESREVSFEAQLAVKQTFGPPKLISVASVLNTTAMSPAGCGALEVTLDVSDQLWERQLMDELSDPNKALAHIVAVESHQRELMKDFLLDEDNAEVTGSKSAQRQNDNNDEVNLLTERGLGAPTVVSKDAINDSGTCRSTAGSMNRNKAEETTRTVAEEYTFDSARDAAEFQSAILALRLVGKEIRNMYQSLELLHMASDAFAGDECVLHVPSKAGAQVGRGNEIETGEGESEEGHADCGRSAAARPGVALDDVYRCLGEMPSIRRNLERFYRHHYPVDLQNHWEESEYGIQGDAVPSLLAVAAEHGGSEDDTGKELYQKKRLLLGIVDFLRLFSPPPGVGAIPRPNPSAARDVREYGDDAGIDGHRARIVSAVTVRKRVAKAAVRVRAYVNAMKIVRGGWDVPRLTHEDVHSSVPNYCEENSIRGTPLYRRRLPFDDDIENIQRDCSSKNEYYEATVGRDIVCNVHDNRHLMKKGSSRPSGYQAYALVGCQMFHLPKETDPNAPTHPLQSMNDPIMALPSLRKIIEANSDQEFFVQAFFSEKKKVALVVLFVRTLPRGVDDAFDTVSETFISGDSSVRDRKLEIFLQLGPGSELPGSVWFGLKVINWILRFSRRGEGGIPVLSNKVRTPFPGMRLSSYTETKHFGGSLQTNDALPKNYVASTARFDEDNVGNPIMKTLFNTLEVDALKHCVFDASLVLEGQNADELPERALGTIRLVHMNAMDSSLSPSYSATGEIAARTDEVEPSATLRGSSWLLQEITQSTMNIFGMGSPQRDVGSNILGLSDQDQDEATASSQNADPYKRDLDALTEILDGVVVPMRKVNLRGSGWPSRKGATTNLIDAVEQRTGSKDLRPHTPRTADGFKISEDELQNVPVLQTCSRNDLTRFYLACYGNLSTAAVRVVESAAWRGLTFPIDTKACRIELRSNQIVQFGEDMQGNPVFYFRNVCLGPWRKDVDASLLAVLHRVETAIQTLSASNPSVKCTIVILMGKPMFEDPAKHRSSSVTDQEGDVIDSVVPNVQDEEKRVDGGDNSRVEAKRNPYALGSDPRIDLNEKYFVHTNPSLIQRIVCTLSAHYPERLAKCLIVPSSGLEKTMGGLSLRTYVTSLRTRTRITILDSQRELKDYINEENLLAFAGGKAVLPPEFFG